MVNHNDSWETRQNAYNYDKSYADKTEKALYSAGYQLQDLGFKNKINQPVERIMQIDPIIRALPDYIYWHENKCGLMEAKIIARNNICRIKADDMRSYRRYNNLMPLLFAFHSFQTTLTALVPFGLTDQASTLKQFQTKEYSDNHKPYYEIPAEWIKQNQIGCYYP